MPRYLKGKPQRLFVPFVPFLVTALIRLVCRYQGRFPPHRYRTVFWREFWVPLNYLYGNFASPKCLYMTLIDQKIQDK